MSSAKFAGELFAWLRRISRDHGLPAAALRLALEISQAANEKTRECYPGQQRLAELIGADVRTVRRLVERLVAGGHLVVEPNRSRLGTSVYRLPDTRTLVSGDDSLDTGHQRPVRTRRQRTSVSGTSGHQCPVADQVDRTSVAARPEISVPATGHSCPSDRTPVSDKPSQNTSQNTSHEPSHSPRERVRRDEEHGGELFLDQIEQPTTGRPTSAKRHAKRAGDGQTAEAFGEFWRTYPRRIAKANAARAFGAALKAGTDPGEIIAGAHRYAAERAGQEERYTAHPATWIRGQRWLDDPMPPGGRQHSHRPDRAAGIQAALDIAAGEFGGDDDGH